MMHILKVIISLLLLSLSTASCSSSSSSGGVTQNGVLLGTLPNTGHAPIRVKIGHLKIASDFSPLSHSFPSKV